MPRKGESCLCMRSCFSPELAVRPGEFLWLSRSELHRRTRLEHREIYTVAVLRWWREPPLILLRGLSGQVLPTSIVRGDGRGQAGCRRQRRPQSARWGGLAGRGLRVSPPVTREPRRCHSLSELCIVELGIFRFGFPCLRRSVLYRESVP